MPRQKSKTKCIGILTSGGDCPGLNAAIRGVAKAAIHEYGIKVIGIQDGFRGLVENRTEMLDDYTVSGILTKGGTILGTSRDKPKKMRMGGKKVDMTDAAVENAKQLGIDCLVCLGGGGTQKNAWHLAEKGGMNVITLPKTIDNDVVNTDVTFGYNTALETATEAIDRLHTTAISHQRIIVCEVMGHKTGWLALGSGLAGGADVILIPEIPYDLSYVAESLIERKRIGKKFSIVALAEGSVSQKEAENKDKGDAPSEEGEPRVNLVARQLQELSDLEARVTSLGHVLRGGVPSAVDRKLCTLLGTKTAELLAEGTYNVMVSVRGDTCEPVPLEDVAYKKKLVPPDHSWIRSARLVGTCLGTPQ